MSLRFNDVKPVEETSLIMSETTSFMYRLKGTIKTNRYCKTDDDKSGKFIKLLFASDLCSTGKSKMGTEL